MLRLCAILSLVIISATVASAQSSGGGGASGGASGSGGATTGATGTGGANSTSPSGAATSNTPGGPNMTPGISTPSLSDDTTVGRAPGINPSNPQDATRRGNSSDRSLPGARNPQDLKRDGTGTPVIITPERR